MHPTVKGPTSALTSFLRERGISVRGSRFTRRDQATDPSTNPTETASGETSGASTEPQQTDQSESRNSADQSNSRQESSDELLPAIAVPVKVASEKKNVKKKKAPESDDDDDIIIPRKRLNIPDVQLCHNCHRRFCADASTVCPACSMFPVHGKKPKKKPKVDSSVRDTSAPILLSLSAICVRTIAKYIDEVEEVYSHFSNWQFGDIPSDTKVKISKIISKQRSLNKNTLRLFLSPDEHTVQLFDCSNLDEDSLLEIGYFCPNLTRLNLSICGRINDSVVDSYSQSFKHLTCLKLGGCYLVSDEAFSRLFTAIGHQLMELSLQEAEKMSSSLQVLVEKAQNSLRCLTLKRCPNIGETGLLKLSSLGNLEKLKLIQVGKDVSDDVFIEILSKLSSSLQQLTLSGYPQLQDKVLEQGLLKCKSLKKLSLKACTSITSSALAKFFVTCNVQLTSLNLARMEIGDDAVIAALNISGPTLEYLNLNSLYSLTEHAFIALVNPLGGASCNALERLDVSWIRCLHDESMKNILNSCKSLRFIHVYGCHCLSEFLLNNEWRNSNGDLIRFLGNEFE